MQPSYKETLTAINSCDITDMRLWETTASIDLLEDYENLLDGKYKGKRLDNRFNWMPNKYMQQCVIVFLTMEDTNNLYRIIQLKGLVRIAKGKGGY